MRHVERDGDHRRRAPPPRRRDLRLRGEPSTVVSVMTYRNGGSLADLLRKQGAERDARADAAAPLRLRHPRPRGPIIHYDLPANILHDGELKLDSASRWRPPPPGPPPRSPAAQV